MGFPTLGRTRRMPFDPNDWDGSKQSADTRFPIGERSIDPVNDERRDTLDSLAAGRDEPAIVSISDIHGYLEEARSALTTLSDHPDFQPVVTADDDRTLHWADNNYVLVFNGDLIDRGPQNLETLQLVDRLLTEAPPGRVRVTLGNHEMGILTPALFMWDRWYSGQVDSAGRRALLRAILDGHIVAAYEGYSYTYVHAGHPQEYSVATVNDQLQAAADQLRGLIGGGADATVQKQITEDYPLVLGMGEPHPKGPGAGMVWLDLRYHTQDSPPQIVGHTRQDEIVQKGSVICQNVIRKNLEKTGGEAVLVEFPTELYELQRTADGSVRKHKF